MPEAPSAGSSGGRGGEERALQLPAPALLFGPAGPSLDDSVQVLLRSAMQMGPCAMPGPALWIE